jgi:hypothetical protein
MAAESGVVPSIKLYSTVAQLSSETDLPQFGALVFITATREFAMAQFTTASDDLTTSTAKDSLGYSHTIYWTKIVL